MNSMTGFGRAEISRKKYRLQVQIVSVNSRFFEAILRLPRVLTGFEQNIRELAASRIGRGKVTITVNIEESTEGKSSAFDAAAAALFVKQLKKLQKELKIPGQIEIGDVASNYESFSSESGIIDEGKIWPDLKKGIEKALTEMVKMRAAEGHNLQSDMIKRVRTMGSIAKKIDADAGKNVSAYKKRLEKRISDIGNGLIIDPQRLAEEVTVFAEKSDVTEECTRLESHIDLFKKALKDSGQIGKKLNFILQEMGREANTIGSKSAAAQTGIYAIALKEEIEKLREQVQNIE